MAARTKPRTGQAATSRCSEDVPAADFHADERHGDTMRRNAKQPTPAAHMNRVLAEYRKAHKEAAEHGIASEDPVALELKVMWSFDENGEKNEEQFATFAAEIENETRRLRAKIDEAKREEAEAYEPPEVTEARWREHVADAYALVRAEESAKESAKQKSGKGVSRYAGQNFGKYHVHPDGQTITVKGDAVQYKITSAAAIDTLDRLLKGTERQDGWVNWSATDRSRFSTPTAKSFAKQYIENKVERRGFGFDFGHAPQARLKK